MDGTLRHKLLTYLAGAALAMSSGPAAATTALAEIPTPVIDDLLDDVEQEGWGAADLTDLANLLAEDPRKVIRRRVAELLASSHADLSASELEFVMRKLARDRDPMVRCSLARSVATWLEALGGFERADLVLDWATSVEPLVRQTVAEAMSYGIDVLAADLIVEQLARDPTPSVRREAARAAAHCYADNPELYGPLLQCLLDDPSGQVRRVARLAQQQLDRG